MSHRNGRETPVQRGAEGGGGCCVFDFVDVAEQYWRAKKDDKNFK
ncbi:hypothetical protein C7S17_0270 [Burkholderia thailandensis]|nr:hypothetical protein [Burkholderia thailandensis]